MAHLIGIQGAEGLLVLLLDKLLGRLCTPEFHHSHLCVLFHLRPQQANVGRTTAGRGNEAYNVVEGHVRGKVLDADELGTLPKQTQAAVSSRREIPQR